MTADKAVLIQVKYFFKWKKPLKIYKCYFTLIEYKLEANHPTTIQF